MMQGQIPAGLQSLIARGMPQTTRPSQIPQGMQVLMNAQRQLEQVANPMTPAGTPTVAGKIEQDIAQRTQPQMPQGMPQGAPQGMPGMLPNDPFREQLMKTLQMQAQQQMQPLGGGQPPEQPPQQQPQPMAAGGIASLPADNMARIENYAHGGVIGFDGEKRSDVPDPLVSQTSDIALQEIESQNAKNARYLADKYKQSLGVMSAIANSGDQEALKKYAASTQENLNALKNFVNTSYGNRAEQVLNSVLSSAAPVEEKPKYQYEEPVKVGVPPAIQQLQGTVAPASKPPTTARPQSIATGIAEPTAADQFAAAQKFVGNFPERQNILDSIERIKKLQAGRPDIEGQGIAALQQHEQERLRQLEEQRGGDFFRRLSALGRDFYERGEKNRLGTIDDVIAARNIENNNAALASKQMQLKLRDAAYQKSIGDEEGYKKSMMDVSALDEKRMGHVINAANISGHLASTVYSSKMTAQTHAADRAQREKERKTNEETNRINKLQSMLARINEDIALKSENLRKNLNADTKYRLPILNASTSKDPKDIEAGKNAEAAIEAEIEARLKPLQDQRSMVLRSLMGDNWGQMTVTPTK